MKTNFVVIRLYNNGNADVETETKTLYTDKNTAMQYVMAARHNGYTENFKIFSNGDQTYWFN